VRRAVSRFPPAAGGKAALSPVPVSECVPPRFLLSGLWLRARAPAAAGAQRRAPRAVAANPNPIRAPLPVTVLL